MLLGVEHLLVFPSFESVLTTANLPRNMIQLGAIRASIRKQGCISGAILRVVHISTPIHLKPVNVFLLRNTKHISYGRKDHYPLLQLVITKLHMIINHTIVAYATIIQICIAFIIGKVMPRRWHILRFNSPYVQSSIIGSRGEITLGSNILYDHHQKGKYKTILFHVFIFSRYNSFLLTSKG